MEFIFYGQYIDINGDLGVIYDGESHLEHSFVTFPDFKILMLNCNWLATFMSDV